MLVYRIQAAAWHDIAWLIDGENARLWKHGATEGERIVSGLFPEEFEEIDRLAMGEDVQQALMMCAKMPRIVGRAKWNAVLSSSPHGSRCGAIAGTLQK